MYENYFDDWTYEDFDNLRERRLEIESRKIDEEEDDFIF